MYKIINNFLLSGDKFIPEMHLRQPGFICTTCGPLQITKKEYKQEIHDIFIKTN